MNLLFLLNIFHRMDPARAFNLNCRMETSVLGSSGTKGSGTGFSFPWLWAVHQVISSLEVLYQRNIHGGYMMLLKLGIGTWQILLGCLSSVMMS